MGRLLQRAGQPGQRGGRRGQEGIPDSGWDTVGEGDERVPGCAAGCGKEGQFLMGVDCCRLSDAQVALWSLLQNNPLTLMLNASTNNDKCFSYITSITHDYIRRGYTMLEGANIWTLWVKLVSKTHRFQIKSLSHLKYLYIYKDITEIYLIVYLYMVVSNHIFLCTLFTGLKDTNIKAEIKTSSLTTHRIST